MGVKWWSKAGGQTDRPRGSSRPTEAIAPVKRESKGGQTVRISQEMIVTDERSGQLVVKRWSKVVCLPPLPRTPKWGEAQHWASSGRGGGLRPRSLGLTGRG